VNLRQQLQAFEGLRLKAYLDTVGVWTIGYGHTGPEVHEGLVWTNEQAEAQLDADIATKTAEVQRVIPWFDRLNEPRQAVIVGMAFQLGTKGLLGFNNTLGAIRDERWHEAANGMLNSKWAKQTPRRVQRLARQMETGDWQ
jgi:lysozyme